MCFAIHYGKNVWGRPVELEDVKYPDHLAKWEIFSDYSSIPQSNSMQLLLAAHVHAAHL